MSKKNNIDSKNNSLNYDKLSQDHLRDSKLNENKNLDSN